MELIRKYFPGLDPMMERQFKKLLEILPGLNQKVNVISRKDIEHLEERHILHSLSIALKIPFSKGESVIDLGTGGGFPGIPLAILYPETRFTLVDSIGKKIKMVDMIVQDLDLKNVRTLHQRAETLTHKANYVVSRAVTAFPILYQWSWPLVQAARGSESNGLIALKGGDLESELSAFIKRVKLYPISDCFEEPFFSSKTIVYLKK